MNKIPMYVRLPVATKEEVDHIASTEKRSPSQLARILVEEALELRRTEGGKTHTARAMTGLKVRSQNLRLQN
jgi:hypothetical protein